MKRSYRYLLNLLLGAGLSFAEAHQIATEQSS
jgi:hypothetical protein